ncbi:HIRA-interacting protein 3 [Scomber scombrus]|uniref:HIRA-interacting protein 3 n=1 Tax=Scomber scombrus TaxID=13677 RepID=A0AAV1NUU5_SCOSC|nr:HIRA-interacting protein 3 [Scomber scombrus]
MKVSEKEAARIHKFVCRQLDAKPDLSSLTLGILKKRYLAHVGCESLSSETRNFMKQVVQEELMKMQENGHDLETKMPQNKRKREEENDEVISERESEDESRAKKSRRQLSSSESEDKEDHKTGSEESEEEEQIKTASGDEEQEVKKSNSKQQMNSENSSDDEKNESEKNESDSSCADSPKEKVKKTPNTTKNGAKTSSCMSPGKKRPQSDEEDEADSESESEKRDKNNVNDSSDDSEKEGNVLVEKKMNGSDSDSSSLTSLEGEKGSETENKQNTEKKKAVGNKESSKSQKDNDKTIARLKRYISLCGVRRNYKKILQDCRSARSMVAVLKKELENLGVQGNPSIKKCKGVKMKREQDQELAELDVSNIIATEGRPKRRGASASKKQQNTPSSAYQRTLNSGSDSDEENTQKGRRRAIDWTNLQGIISDDADSD